MIGKAGVMIFSIPLPLVATFLMSVGAALVHWGVSEALAARRAVHGADDPAPPRPAPMSARLSRVEVSRTQVSRSQVLRSQVSRSHVPGVRFRDKLRALALGLLLLAIYVVVMWVLCMLLTGTESWLHEAFPVLTECSTVAMFTIMAYFIIRYRASLRRPAAPPSVAEALLDSLPSAMADGMASHGAALPDIFGLHLN